MDWPGAAGPRSVLRGMATAAMGMVETRLGTQEEWRNLVSEAHEEGLAVIMRCSDCVYGAIQSDTTPPLGIILAVFGLVLR